MVLSAAKNLKIMCEMIPCPKNLKRCSRPYHHLVFACKAEAKQEQE